MSRGRQHFRQSDLVKALKAMAQVGVLGRVEIAPDGRMVVVAEKLGQGQDVDHSANEWDSVR